MDQALTVPFDLTGEEEEEETTQSCELRALGEKQAVMDDLEYWLQGATCSSGATRRSSVASLAEALARPATLKLARAHGILSRALRELLEVAAEAGVADQALGLAASAAALLASMGASATKLDQPTVAAIATLLNVEEQEDEEEVASPASPSRKKPRRGFFASKPTTTGSPNRKKKDGPTTSAKAAFDALKACCDRALEKNKNKQQQKTKKDGDEWRRRRLWFGIRAHVDDLRPADFACLVVVNSGLRGASSRAAKVALGSSGALGVLADRVIKGADDDDDDYEDGLPSLRLKIAMDATAALLRNCEENCDLVQRERPRLVPALVRHVARSAERLAQSPSPAALERCALALSTLVDLTNDDSRAASAVGASRGLGLLLNTVEICRRVQEGFSLARERRREEADDEAEDDDDAAAQEGLALEAQLLALSVLANCTEDDVSNAVRIVDSTVGHVPGCAYLAARLSASTSEFRDELLRDAASCRSDSSDWRVVDLVGAAHLAFPLACVATADESKCRDAARDALIAAGASLRYLARLLEAFVALSSLGGPGTVSTEVLKTCVHLVGQLRELEPPQPGELHEEDDDDYGVEAAARAEIALEEFEREEEKGGESSEDEEEG